MFPHRTRQGRARRRSLAFVQAFVQLVLLALLSLSVQAEPLHAPQDLRGSWRFHPGEPGAEGPRISSSGFDVSGWARAEVPGEFARSREEIGNHQRGWYRKVVAPDLALKESSRPLGIAVGKVNSAYEIWVGGILLGGVGDLPDADPGDADPDDGDLDDTARGDGEDGSSGRIDYDRHAVYPVPAEAFTAGGELVVALHVWTHPQFGAVGGPHAGPFLFGEYGDLVERESRREIPTLFFAGLFFLLGIFHLELYRRRHELRGYLWFASVSVLFSVYSLLVTQWKYRILPELPFAFLKEAEHVVVLVLMACFVELVWNLLGIPVGRGTRAVQFLSLSFAGLVIVVPGMGINQTLLLIFQGLVVWQILLGTFLALRQLRRKSREARMIFAGALAGSLFFFHDILVDRGLIQEARLTTYGFALFVLFLAATLGEQFARRLRQAESSREREEEMRRAEEVARRSSEAKTEFLANVSHEIRTPMTAILGGLELLRARELPGAIQSRLEVIHRSARDLLRVIDEILDFSKVEAGRIELSENDFDPRKSLRALVDLFGPAARSRNLSLRLEGEESLPPSLHGDVGRWRQVLLNILSNAVKFTPEGQVIVRASGQTRSASDDGPVYEVRVEIADTGIGIEPEHLEHLFQPFTQADASTSRRYGGTGLGLAISHRLAGLLGGRLEVESRKGTGSTFRVFVPFLLTGNEAPSSGEHHLFDLGPRRGEADSPRILLAEDNEVNRMIVKAHVEALGYEVVLAHDGHQVLEILDREHVDAVLMDCQMPHLDGYEATRRIRLRDAPDRSVPVIALTAHAFEGERARCLEAGMDDYLSKPFRNVELKQILERWVSLP